MEIRNPGKLYGNLTIDDLRRGNVSKRRNPLIADLFRRIDMVEAWGRGMSLILEKEPNVKFREVGDLFIAGFGRPSFKEEDVMGSTTQETTQEKIIVLLMSLPTITGKLLAQQVGISENGIKYHLNKLRQAGRIRHVGPTRAGRWEVLKGDHSNGADGTKDKKKGRN